MIDPEMSARIQLMRQRQLSGETLSVAELTEAITILRQGRVHAQAGSTASKEKKAAAGPVDTSALLSALKAGGSGLPSPVAAPATRPVQLTIHTSLGEKL